MSTPTPSSLVFVVKLRAAPDRGALRGRIEHVMSGRRHDFDNGVALLACLAHEQAQVLLAAGDDPPADHPPPSNP